MRKKSIIIGCGVAALAVAVATIMYIRYNSNKMIALNPVCIGEFRADLLPFYEEYRLEPGTELTWWEQFRSIDGYEKFSREYKIPIVEVDFANTSYIYSFGRKIDEIRYGNRKDNGFNSYVPIVTFENEYKGNVVFIYTLERRVKFMPTILNARKFYIIVDGERIEWVTESESMMVLYRYNTRLD